MIKIENGESTLDGSLLDIISDYTTITKHILSACEERGIPNGEVEHLLEVANKIARMSSEELDKEKRSLEVMLMMKLFG